MNCICNSSEQNSAGKTSIYSRRTVSMLITLFAMIKWRTAQGYKKERKKERKKAWLLLFSFVWSLCNVLAISAFSIKHSICQEKYFDSRPRLEGFVSINNVRKFWDRS